MGMSIERSFQMANVIVKTSRCTLAHFALPDLFCAFILETRRVFCELNLNEAAETNLNFAGGFLLSH